MKIMGHKEFENKISVIASKYPNCGVYNSWKKFNRFSLPLTIIIFFVLAQYTKSYIKQTIAVLFMHGKTEMMSEAFFVFALIASILAINILLIILHEFLHIVSYPKAFSQAVIVINLPYTISVHYDKWLKRNEQLKALLAPFVIIMLLIIALCIILKQVELFLWLTAYNIAQSSSDIFSFFYILKNVSKNDLMYGNYIRCQR